MPVAAGVKNDKNDCISFERGDLPEPATGREGLMR